MTPDTMTAPEWQLLATERQLQDTLWACAKRCGWEAYHTHDSRRSEPGFPDLVCVKAGRILFFEIKKQGGGVRPEQRRWIAALADVPMVLAAVVRPIPKADGELSFDDALEELTR